MGHTACFELSMYPSSAGNKVHRLEIDRRKETKPNVTGECFPHPSGDRSCYAVLTALELAM